MIRTMAAAGLMALALASCSTGVEPSSTATPDTPAPSSTTQSTADPDRFPNVVGADLMATTGDRYTLAVTISSPYDSPDRYADGWRVLTSDGAELGAHELLHDHASEQPFTRTQFDLQIPADIPEVVVEGRDQQNGYGGQRFTVQVPSPAR
jgi:hypothetical protein